MEDHDDFAFEPVPGLPEKLPQGEKMLWQESPQWRALAVSAFHVRKIAVYFGLILALKWVSAWGNVGSISELLTWSVGLVAVGAVAIGILCGLAYLYARGTIYTLTTKRFVFRSGLALPVTLNLPLALIETAAVTKSKDGVGSVVMSIVKPNRIAFLVLWPNAKPFSFTNPQPMLRCVANVDAVAAKVAAALEGEAGIVRTRQPVRVGQVSADQGQAYPAGASAAA